MLHDKASPQSIAVIGAGIIGLSCALELADRGRDVTIFEKAWPPRGASWAAAGMLAPAFEAAEGLGAHPKLFDLCDASAGLWPDWAAMLEARTGLPSGYMPGPSLAIATSAKEADRLASIQSRLTIHPLAPEACLTRLRDIEPAIEAEVQAAMLLPSDGQADNRRTIEALMACIEAHKRIRIKTQAPALRLEQGRLDHAGHDATLITSGWQSANVSIDASGAVIPLAQLDPVFSTLQIFGGQMLAVAPIENGPKMTIRCGDLYIVPKSDRIIIGATTEPGRALKRPEADVIQRLKARAVVLCPALADAPIIETWAGIRPGTQDHAPLLGLSRVDDLYVATGHYRNGILLAPITAQIMADLIVSGITSDLAAGFSPHARHPEQV